MSSRFQQVNVFSSHPLKGNPLAVVFCEPDTYTTQTMQQFARWTQLSETVFVSPATDNRADYQIRIFTPSEELPFAGHPTLGACHSWLAGRRQAVIVQQSAIGLVEIRQIDERLYFQAPPLLEHRPFAEHEIEQLLAATGLTTDDIYATSVLSNGPTWHCAMLKSADQLQKIIPNYAAMDNLCLGLCAKIGDETDLVVRAFTGYEQAEDPVTGSLNAVLAQWLIPQGVLPTEYRVQQGAAIGAYGELWVTHIDEQLYVGGHSTTLISGEVEL